MSTRTSEQKAADEALTYAIQQVRVAYAQESDEPENLEYLMTDYIVVFSATRFADDGDTWSMVGHMYRDSDVPVYRILGLLDFALMRVKAAIASDE